MNEANDGEPNLVPLDDQTTTDGGSEKVTQPGQDHEAGDKVDDASDNELIEVDGLSPEDQEAARQLVQEVVADYKQAVFSGDVGRAQEIVASLASKPEVKHLVAPELKKVDEVVAKSDQIKSELKQRVDTGLRTLQQIADAPKPWHAVNAQVAASFIENFQNNMSAIQETRNPDELFLKISILKDWVSDSMIPKLNRFRKIINENFSGNAPQYVIEESKAINRLIQSVAAAETSALQIRSINQ